MRAFAAALRASELSPFSAAQYRTGRCCLGLFFSRGRMACLLADAVDAGVGRRHYLLLSIAGLLLSRLLLSGCLGQDAAWTGGCSLCGALLRPAACILAAHQAAV